MARRISLKTSIPGPRSVQLMQDRIRHVSHGPYHVTPVFIQSAKGSQLTDVDGNTFLDLGSGIGTMNVGHMNDRVISALSSSHIQHLHLSFNVTPYESYISVCEKLNQYTPGLLGFPKKSFLANSGAEAVENAIKLARAFTKKENVIAFEHAFHGRTYMAMSLTYKDLYKQGFGPLNSGVHFAPFPYRWDKSMTEDQVSDACFDRFASLSRALFPKGVAAVIFEPVLGEGGFFSMPFKFAQNLSSYCKENNILLIADEIQSGFGRTGTMFACEQLDIIPDLVTTAKALGGGLPLSAVTGRAEIMDCVAQGAIGGTFGGNPLACAAALAVFATFEETDILESSRKLGKQLRMRLEKMQQTFPERIATVHGMGTMLAIEVYTDSVSRNPDYAAVKALIKHCYENGVILMSAGTFGHVVRFLPPLTTTHEELDEALNVVETAMVRVLS